MRDLFTRTIVTLLVFSTLVYASYDIECEGHNQDTSSYVYGECSDGEFEGYDSDTGSYVYGECSYNGDLEGYDSNTNAYVYGECSE